ncbi:MAG: N-acetylmuramoyl-L-alanine amidase [Gammaproteobacteria bacterium]|nr:N-acetylmuramoyl-L-alanine amidase [Gammaproteobacteria bacterium]
MQKQVFWCVLWLLSCCVSQAATLQAVEVRQAAGKTSLFFSLSEPVKHRVFTLVNPQRVVVDFDRTRLSMRLQDIHVDPRFIKRVRSGQPTPGTLRLVFEVTHRMTPYMNRWSKNRLNQGVRLDLAAKGEGVPAPVLLPVKGRPIAVKHAPSRALRTVIVVLDPGHGGKDPGAHGPRGTKEKDVVFHIAERLKTLIDRQPGMKAVLTRRGDYYLGLRERLTIARRDNADIFVSIHADAFQNPHSTGASIYALSQSGATSEAARWLAEKENNSELGGVNLSELDDKNGLVRTVLIDLSQTATVGASVHMGERLLRELDTMTNLHHSHVEQARFAVLKSPDIPSVLIETGFISNVREEANLRSIAYQQRLTQAIFKGIKGYFWEYPPQGTFVEYWSEHRVHQVARGETLENIAKLYRMPVKALQQANHLSGLKVSVGQKLRMPSWA